MIDDEYEHTDIIRKQMTSYSGSTDQKALNGQLSVCDQAAKFRVTPNPAKTGNEDTKIRSMMMATTEDDTGNF